MSRIRRHLTFANIVSVIALFLALGGISAYAASKIGAGDIKRNAVRARHIKNGQVKRSEIARAAVSSSKLNLVRFDQRSSEVEITGSQPRPLGPRVTLDVPAKGTIVFEATANIAKSANTVDCRLEATNANFGQFLFQPAVAAGNPPEPFQSGLVPSHPGTSGRRTFRLQAVLNGQTTESCSFDHIKFYGFALG
jgi:hypothetical protein